MTVKVDTSDVQRLARRVKKLSRAWKGKGVEIRCRGTADRSGSENAEIFREQADAGRNPLFLADDEHNKAASVLSREIAKEVEGKAIRPDATLDDIGSMFVEWVKEHIQSGESEGGSMKPLSEAVRKYKARHYPGKPILERTGQLLRSLCHEVVD